MKMFSTVAIRVAILAVMAVAPLAFVGASGAAAPHSSPAGSAPSWTVLVVCRGTQPTVCVQVTCPSNPRMGIACRITEKSGPVTASTRVLVLQLPRALKSVSLLCRRTPRQQIACRVTKTKTSAVSGTRIVKVLLPRPFNVTRITCPTNPRQQFACRAQPVG
jgi:hypothetical protein